MRRITGTAWRYAAVVAVVFGISLGCSAAGAGAATWSPVVQTGVDADAASCAMSSLCAVVGYVDGSGTVGGAALFVGGVWQPAAAIDPHGGDETVSCAPNTSFCVAGAGDGSVETYDGTSWSQPQLIDPGETYNGNVYPETAITSVSCPTASFCMAGDQFGRAMTYDGTSWTAPQQVIGPASGEPAQAEFSSLSCPTTSFCMALGGDGSDPTNDFVYVTYENGSWTETGFPGAYGAEAPEWVSCASPSFCVGIGEFDHAWVYRNGSWGPKTTLVPPTGSDPYLLDGVVRLAVVLRRR